MYNLNELVVERKLIGILEHHGVVLNVICDRDVNIFDYGLDSIGFITFLVEIEEEFNIEIDDKYLSKIDTVTIRELVDLINNCEK